MTDMVVGHPPDTDVPALRDPRDDTDDYAKAAVFGRPGPAERS